jgi:hypothetical protein
MTVSAYFEMFSEMLVVHTTAETAARDDLQYSDTIILHTPWLSEGFSRQE